MNYFEKSTASYKAQIKKAQANIALLKKLQAKGLTILENCDQILLHDGWNDDMPKQYAFIKFNSPSRELFDKLLEVMTPVPIFHWVNGCQHYLPILPKNEKKIVEMQVKLDQIKDDPKYHNPGKYGIACPFYHYPNLTFWGYFDCGGLPLVKIQIGNRSGVNAQLKTYKSVEEFLQVVSYK